MFILMTATAIIVIVNYEFSVEREDLFFLFVYHAISVGPLQLTRLCLVSTSYHLLVSWVSTFSKYFYLTVSAGMYI